MKSDPNNIFNGKKSDAEKQKHLLWMIIIAAVILVIAVVATVMVVRQSIRTSEILSSAATKTEEKTETETVNKETSDSAITDFNVHAGVTGDSSGERWHANAEQDKEVTPTPTEAPTETPTPEPTLSPEQQLAQQVEQKLGTMTTEEKVAQLFFITPDALNNTETTEAGDVTRSNFSQIPVGGFVLFENNIISPEQTAALNQNLKNISMERIGVEPFIGTDEEGGTVLRIADVASFGVADVGDMSGIGATGDPGQASQVGSTIGAYLSQYGFNLDFAPVADTLSNPENTVVSQRSFGTDANLVSQMVAAEVQSLEAQNVSAVLKHFPGHGSTSADSHNGAAVSYRTLDELRTIDLLPFQAGIAAGADFVMAGHISLPNATSDGLPATLSAELLTGVLRQEMGFQGIIITDAMNMGAITAYYSSPQAAIMAIQAGVDMILMPSDFRSAYSGVVAAVNNGTISQERLNESVRRILSAKMS